MISVGKKSLLFRTVYILIGISALFLFDMVFFFVMQKIDIPFWYWFLILLFVYIFYKLTKIINLRYEFGNDFIAIYTSRKKGFKLNKESIDKIKKISNMDFIKCFGIRHYPTLKEHYYLTSSSDVLKINMKDGQIIYISPKKYPEEILDNK